MAIKLIGRKKEKASLEKAYASEEAEMISIIGRRRVGKTFLIQTVFNDKIDFEVSGIQNAQGTEQLRNFTAQLKGFFPQAVLIQTPNDWLDAFILLIELLKSKQKKEKMVVFLDEVPWMSTHKSGFLRGLSYFWNSWAVKQNIVVILCGSAASWMIQKVLKNKGGLHNRVTKRIRLRPFSLFETEQYLQSRNVATNRYQLLQIYMAMGGIPHYLKEIETGQSAVQNIDRICFQEDGLLRDEFESLYPALFEHANYHIAIVKALAVKHTGMGRGELIKLAKLPNGGRVSQVLEELSESGFITLYPSYGKRKKDIIYRLTDEYSLFYLRFIEKTNPLNNESWASLSQTQTAKTWSGYAYENICLKHITQIKNTLKIGGVHSVTSSFYKRGTAEEAGTQIDLLIDRNDNVINLIEVKFYNTKFVIDKTYAVRLRDKIRVFTEASKIRKQLLITMLTTFGVKENTHSLGLVTGNLDMEDLFGAE